MNGKSSYPVDFATRYDRTGAAFFDGTGCSAGFIVSIGIDTEAIAVAAYGPDRLRTAVGLLHRFAMAEAANVPGLGVSDLRWAGDDRLVLFVTAPYDWPDGDRRKIFRSTLALQSRVLHWVLICLSRPVDVDGQRFMLGLSGSIGLATVSDVEKFDTAAIEILEIPSGSDYSVDSSRPSRHATQSLANYRAAMSTAVELYDALDAGDLSLSWQKIAASYDPGLILYSEGLLRSIADERVVTEPDGAGRNGGFFKPGPAVMAAEQAGIVRRLDAWVVNHVVERLRQDPDAHLGCNISPHSAVIDGWWSEIIDQLSIDNGIARRLVLEITESAHFPSMAMAVDFCHRMKSLGCKIAIDDFGAGRATISDVAVLNPDIIKIDGSFLRWAAAGGARSPAKEELMHLVGFAQCRGRTVVMEGVESAHTRDVAVRVGGEWLQGFDVAMPRLSASLLTGAKARRGYLY